MDFFGGGETVGPNGGDTFATQMCVAACGESNSFIFDRIYPVFLFFVFTNWTRKAESENNLNGCFPAVARQGESNLGL